MNVSLFFMKFRLKYFPKFAGKYDFNKILKSCGIEVGEHTIFYDPNSMSIDRQRPWMLHIGDYCKITKGVVILTHDYSRSVLRRKYGPIVGEAGKTFIGDNVFIGMNSVILMGANIGNNVIVGAGSVVNGTFPDNCVIAGNPAQIIRSLDDHYDIMKKRENTAASVYLNSFYERYKRIPSVQEMGPFFHLFLERSNEAIVANRINLDLNGDSKDEILTYFLNSTPQFDGYESFVQSLLKEYR